MLYKMKKSTMSVSQVRNDLPQIVAEVAQTGVSVTISRYGKPLAMIAPVPSTSAAVHPLRGVPLVVAEDFDAPLDHYWEALEDEISVSRAAEEPTKYGKKRC